MAIVALNQFAQIEIENDPTKVNMMSTVSHRVNGNIESIFPKSNKIVYVISNKTSPWANRLMILPGGLTLKNLIGAFINPASEMSCRLRPDLTMRLNSNR